MFVSAACLLNSSGKAARHAIPRQCYCYYLPGRPCPALAAEPSARATTTRALLRPPPCSPLRRRRARADLLVLGCGKHMQQVPAALRAALDARGVAIEPASTPNAVATYNILAQEGRAVLAALLPVSG